MGIWIKPILWRVVANVLIIVIVEWLLDLLATQLAAVAPTDASVGTKLVSFFLGGVVLVGAVFRVVWMWLPYIRPRSQTPDGF
jgi:hypothetical protein